MKTLVFIIAVIFCVTAQVSLLAQNKVNTNNYLLSLSIRDSKFYPKGYLMSTTDSTITISTRNSILQKDQRIFQVEDIEYIDLKNKDRRLFGAVLGASVGIMTAVICGLTSHQNKDDFFYMSRDEVMVLAGLITIPSGIILGAAVVDFKRPIHIKNKRKNYAEQRSLIEKYKYRVN